MCLDGWIIFWALFWFALLPLSLVSLVTFLIIRRSARDAEPEQPLSPEGR